MNHNSQMPVFERLTSTTVLTERQAAVVKQTYMLFGVSVISAMAGGYFGATSETLRGLFANWMGWIVALVLLNVVPRVAIAARHNPALGVSALVFDGLLAGLAISPLLWIASMVSGTLIIAALAITAAVFIGVTGYIMVSGRTFAAPRALMTGMFFALIGAMLLNGWLQLGWLGFAISLGVGAMGVIALVTSTSAVLNSPDADSPIPGALALFAGVFNIFVAVLNILLRFAGGGRRD
jgi:FtsH-binding integral membrane protein